MSDEPQSLTQSAEKWLSLAALVVAPTSLITGLCYFFGLLFIRNKLKYFGVEPSTLGYTSADYAVTTIGLFFFAALRVLVVLAVLTALAVAVRRWVATGRRIALLRNIAWLLTALGAVSLGIAVVWLVSKQSLIDLLVDTARQMYMAGTIAAGIVLLTAGCWVLTLTGGVGGLRRLPKPAERTLLTVAAIGLVVALFWVTDLYAVDQGKGHGEYAADQLWAADGEYIAVQLDTTEELKLPDDQVKKTPITAEGSPGARVYRYECLRVLEARGGRYVLVPAKWSRGHGYAITVTPDATHRITGIMNSTPVAKGPNIDPFWQCPELVRTFDKPDLVPIMIGPEDAQTLLGAANLRAAGPDTESEAVPGNSDGDTWAKGCADEGDPSETSALPPYPAGVPAAREREITGDSAAGRAWLRQRAMKFDNPAEATGFMTRVRNHWDACVGKTATVNRHGETQARTLGTHGLQDRILSMPDAAPSSTVADCTQALTAKSNIVVAVDLCGTGDPARAVAIAYEMRERIPTD
ncbi:hypothetical protein A5719_15550 [Mycolicibacterium peregrinum]|uniref:sensor domain-containing protein n=1 Tax=Mycolicibacterium peregrinum TaxID=43304 RepID=UPI0007EAF304|nr:sensor domain-containing protein [Mycolicibacterium peregrinum]OBF40275.1 hypothetical protein A5719_15550 [Mycolicibacterium peregrinum]